MDIDQLAASTGVFDEIVEIDQLPGATATKPMRLRILVHPQYFLDTIVDPTPNVAPAGPYWHLVPQIVPRCVATGSGF